MRRRIRMATAAFALAGAACAVLWVSAERSPAAPADRLHDGPQAAAVGVAGCAATACHGGNGTDLGVGSAYSRWKTLDPHARAGEALSGPLAKSMAAILHRTGVMAAHDTAAASPLCIQCHGSPAPGHATDKFAADEGVACEQCHGRAGAYLDQHYEPQWRSLDPAGKAALGFVDTKQLPVRAEACLKCHQGAPGYEVTHDLIAAGHPVLRFELRTYLAHYPGKHWREDADHDAAGRQARGEAPFDLAAWSAGQHAAAAAAAKLAAQRAGHGGRAVDFAEGDCTACHQNLMRHPAERPAPRLGTAAWFGWQESGLRLAAPEAAEPFAKFARRAALAPADAAALRHAAETVALAPPAAPADFALRRRLEQLLDHPAIPLERWEAALQRRLAAEALVAAARETYDGAWASRPGVAPALAKLRRATAAWQAYRPAAAAAAWKALEESLDATLDD